MADPVRKQAQTKRSRDLGRKEGQTGKAGAPEAQTSKLPSVKHRDKKSRYLLDEGHKERLKAQYDSLCRPSEDKEVRVENWIKLNAKKDKNIREWLQSYTQQGAFPDLVRFHPEQFLQSFAGRNLDHASALKQTNALVVSQSIFSSSASFNAAREVVKLVAKSVIWTPEQLLVKLRNIDELGVTQSHLEAAAADVGSNSPAIRDLLNLAADMQATAERTEDQVEYEIKALRLALAWLDLKAPNLNRNSAPTGTISLDSLRAKAKTVSIKTSPSSEKIRKPSREPSGAETPPKTPRGETVRDEKPAEEAKSKSRSRNKLAVDSAREDKGMGNQEKVQADSVQPKVSGQEVRKTNEGMPELPKPAGATNDPVLLQPGVVEGGPPNRAHPISMVNTPPLSPQARPVTPSSYNAGSGANTSEPSTPRGGKAHFRQPSGTNQNPAVVADLNKVFGIKEKKQ